MATEDLETRTLRQFDKLVESGSLIYKDRPPIHLPAKPFDFQIRIAPSLSKKPQIPIKHAEQLQQAWNQEKNNYTLPFAKDPPDFVLQDVGGSSHTLRLNKFCVVRPQLILHTNEFEPQIEPLSAADIEVAWEVLCRMKTPYIVIYNGGMQGGWSLPHRHMQLLPRPSRDVHDLFPDIYGIEDGRVPNIPFRHAVSRIPSDLADTYQLYTMYKDLLAATGVEGPDFSHNLVMVREWMLIIPRSRAGQEGVNIANAAAMMGMIWIPSEEVLETWRNYPNQEHYDFIIIGGGTGGLVVANRLSEVKNIRVAVIEAGSDERNNPIVTNATDIEMPGLGTHIDWNYTSVSQRQLANRKMSYSAGKALGGSSAINGMVYIRNEKPQVDAWEKVGNEGWNWKSLLPYFKKSERYQIPTPAQAEQGGATYIEGYHGFKGHLDVGYTYRLINGTLPEDIRSAWQDHGYTVNKDLNGGNVRGFSVYPKTVDREANMRSDAAKAYLYPIENRSNLEVVKGLVSKVIWDDDSGSNSKPGSTITAKGVEFVSPDGVTRVLYATKEVILSAGALRSPPILELSGVGNPKILAKHNIPTKLELAGVGENLQDQLASTIVYQGTEFVDGTTPYAGFATASDILPNVRNVERSTRNNLREWARIIAKANGNAVSARVVEYLLGVQHDLIFKNKVPIVEILTLGRGNTIGQAFLFLLPFSRGNVHISSRDLSEYPTINPNYLEIEWDVQPQIQAAKFARKFWKSKSVARRVGAEIVPGISTVPNDATDKQWEDWIRSTAVCSYHAVGTLSMLPKELGGVVDKTLLVYGTKNVRVVDASVLPFQVNGHPTATLYAVAERAADIIKRDHKLS
ncbi:hypothetical protein FQN57_007316 [Myotisia sp. PD_48]|nr:hypothetical protein FQN57_007316 [Myotisia sp. PD_48]